MTILNKSQVRKLTHRFNQIVARKSVEKQEYDMTLRDGSRLVMQSISFPVSIAGKNLILAIACDITAQKSAEENLLKQRAQLRSSQRELKYFSRRLICVREEERKHLSSVLHK